VSNDAGGTNLSDEPGMRGKPNVGRGETAARLLISRADQLARSVLSCADVIGDAPPATRDIAFAPAGTRTEVLAVESRNGAAAIEPTLRVARAVIVEVVATFKLAPAAISR
jgi:hypothetical protein